MKLMLHTPNSNSRIKEIYIKAFKEATELYVLTAYLTEWDTSLELNPECEIFRIIVGKDFGITKEKACLDVMRWLPAERKSQFLVADEILGFHPKAIFWKDIEGKAYSLIGSSNLTKAAFETNYEANIFAEISLIDFDYAVSWVKEIENKAVVISEDWLSDYKEIFPIPNNQKDKNSQVKPLYLPNPKGSIEQVKNRRERLNAHLRFKKSLHELFLSCKDGKVSSSQFYDQLPSYWSSENGNRIQGLGWERLGKSSDFKAISESFIRILNATDSNRDDMVVRELDRLHSSGNQARGAFFSEILCLTYPDKYPVLNKPVRKYLKDIKFGPPKGASEGAAYLVLAKKLRASIAQNPKHPAKNLAELDSVIWLEYKD